MVAITSAGIRQSSRQAVSAAVIGNVLEWYDFAVYGFMAAIIGKNFFPSGDEVSQLLAAFAVYGVGFLARPIGGVVIGRIGDTKGRKTALILTIMLMAVGTVLIGIIPTYATIGVLGPLLILVARLMQGFSAGGEWGGSTAFIVEWADEGERGFLGSFQQCSVAGGLLLGSGVAALITTLLDPAAMEAWGWRVPFLLGALLGPVGMYMRRNIDETPAYQRAMREPEPARSPDDATPFWLAARAFGFTILWTVAFYIFLNYMPTFTKTYAKLSSAEALWSNTIGLLVLVAAIPVMGLLSDRRAEAAAAYVLHLLHRAALSGFRADPVRAAAWRDHYHPDRLRRDHRLVLRCRAGGDLGDLPDAHSFDMDDHRLRAVGRHFRRLRALHCNVADRPHRLADLAGFLRDRRGNHQHYRDRTAEGDGTREAALTRPRGDRSSEGRYVRSTASEDC